MNKKFDYSDYATSPFSENGMCYARGCSGRSLGRATYAKCCCEMGSSWEAETGAFSCDRCPKVGSQEHKAMCGSASSHQSAVDHHEIDTRDLGVCQTERDIFNDISFEECCCATSLNPSQWTDRNGKILKYFKK